MQGRARRLLSVCETPPAACLWGCCRWERCASSATRSWFVRTFVSICFRFSRFISVACIRSTLLPALAVGHPVPAPPGSRSGLGGGSPVFPGNPCLLRRQVLCPRLAPSASPWAAVGFRPRWSRLLGTANSPGTPMERYELSRLDSSAPQLAAYASCRPFGEPGSCDHSPGYDYARLASGGAAPRLSARDLDPVGTPPGRFRPEVSPASYVDVFVESVSSVLSSLWFCEFFRTSPPPGRLILAWAGPCSTVWTFSEKLRGLKGLNNRAQGETLGSRVSG